MKAWLTRNKNVGPNANSYCLWSGEKPDKNYTDDKKSIWFNGHGGWMLKLCNSQWEEYGKKKLKPGECKRIEIKMRWCK